MTGTSAAPTVRWTSTWRPRRASAKPGLSGNFVATKGALQIEIHVVDVESGVLEQLDRYRRAMEGRETKGIATPSAILERWEDRAQQSENA